MQLLTMVMPFLKNNWKFICAVFLLITFYVGGYRNGEQHVQARWDEANARAIIAARQTEYNNAIFSNQIGREYENRLQTVDDTYRAAMSGLYTATNSYLSATTNPASQPDATTCTNQIHRATKQARLELARQAEINTQRLIALQGWVKRVY